MLAPPTPLKFFVLAAGVFEVPLVSFASAIALARAFRYFGVGYLAVRYGADALPYLMQHKLEASALVIALVTASYVASRFIFRAKKEENAAQEGLAGLRERRFRSSGIHLFREGIPDEF